MSDKNSKKSYVKEVIHEINNISGFIDANKRKKLKSKYPDLRFIDVIINSHNDSLNRSKNKSQNKSKKNSYNPSNKSKHKRHVPEESFKKRLKHFDYIDQVKRKQLNPNDNSNYDKFIDMHNKRFIDERKKVYLKEFKDELNKFDNFIEKKDINEFKIKYNKGYHNYYISLNMDKLIDNFNKKLEKKQMREALSFLRSKYSLQNSSISDEDTIYLKSKYPRINLTKVIEEFNKKYFDKLYSKTEMDVYYLNEYVIKDEWDYVENDRAELSKEILKYKNSISKYVNKFTNEIIEFIENLSNYGLDSNIEKIFLISIKKKKKNRDKHSPMKKTINIIENNYNKGLIKCKQEIIDFNNALVRIEDVNASHLNTDNKPEYEDHLRTIRFMDDEKYNFKDSIFILMDDITTRGTIMNACGDILIKNKIEKDKIYKLAIAETVWD